MYIQSQAPLGSLALRSSSAAPAQPESSPQTLDTVEISGDTSMDKFKGVPWKMFKVPGIQAQIVSDPGGTWAHSKSIFALPGLSFAHSHPASQRTTVLKGELKVKVGHDKAHVLHAGDSVFIPPNVYHRITVVTPRFEALDEWHPRRNDLDPPK